jgi:hypothetical protein
MAKSSAQVVLGMRMLDPKVQKAMADVQANSNLRPGATEAELNIFAKQVQEAVSKALQ